MTGLMDSFPTVLISLLITGKLLSAPDLWWIPAPVAVVNAGPPFSGGFFVPQTF